MGKRGPKPKPLAQLIAEGSSGVSKRKRRAEKAAAIKPLLPGMPKKPTFDDQPYASEKWDELVELMMSANIITKLDADCIELYCKTWQSYRLVEIIVFTKDGPIIEDENGMREHPGIKTLNTICATLLKLQDKLGLNPANRDKIKTIAVTIPIKKRTELKV